MLKNNNLVEEFKKSLTATIRSIGKSDNIEVNFTQEPPSINGKVINLIEPNLTTLDKKINYIRAEADSMALKIRLHEKKIHEKYLSKNDLTNQIFDVIEKSRVEAEGSQIFKGVKNNLFEKHKLDLQNLKYDKDKDKEIIKAFRYVSYNELTSNKLTENINVYNKI